MARGIIELADRPPHVPWTHKPIAFEPSKIAKQITTERVTKNYGDTRCPGASGRKCNALLKRKGERNFVRGRVCPDGVARCAECETAMNRMKR